MKCIYCGNNESKVLDSRSSDDFKTIRRRRECTKCGKRYTTFETIETTPILVIKNDGSRQIFDANKIKRGIIRACEKRPVSIQQIDSMVDEIQKKVHNDLNQEIPSSQIGEYVMEQLRLVDDVAYIRFASVYRKFADMTHFMDFLKEYSKKTKIHDGTTKSKKKTQEES